MHEAGFSQQVGKDTFIPENHFYKLCFKAKNEAARNFQDIVTDEILPSIRKTGGYIMEKEGDTDDDILSRAILIAQHKIKEREQRIVALEEQNRLNEEQARAAAPKVLYFDNVMQGKNIYTSTQMAKELGLRSAEWFHMELKKKGVMFCQSGQWLLMAKHCGKDYTKPRNIGLAMNRQKGL